MPPVGTLHENLLYTHARSESKDVRDKYKIIETLNEGSMGFISLVKLRDSKIGGSALKPLPDKTSDKKGMSDILGKVFHNYKSKMKELQVKVGRKMKKDDMFTLSPNERRQIEVLYALKEIRLDCVRSKDRKIYTDELRNEISILKSMDHPHIVKAHEVFETKNQIFLVMEICYGGDLHDRAPYSEKDSARIAEDLLSAINYMHKHGIVHRDLKQENIVFDSDLPLPQARIKVIDFGLSKKFSGGKAVDEDMIMTAWVGTRYTMAPEVFERQYTSQVDLWSIGVIIYMCICDNFPFYDKNKNKMISLIKSGQYSMSARVWDGVSKECKNLIKQLLVVDPKKRLTAAEALDQRWFDKQHDKSDHTPSDETLREVGQHLMNYRHTSDLKRLALNVIAKNSTSKEIIALRKVFEEFDANKDGIITFQEFKQGLRSSGNILSDEEIKETFKSIAVNDNGHIMYTEFLAASIEAQGRIEEERIAQAFDRVDISDDGNISKKELVDILGKSCPKEQIMRIIKEQDLDGDGEISYQEFRRVFRESTLSLSEKLGDLEELQNLDSLLDA